MNAPCKIDNAPGLKWRALKDRWEARWHPSDAGRAKDLKVVSLWTGTMPTPTEVSYIQLRCNTLKTEECDFLKGKPMPEKKIDTLGDLIEAFRHDEDSPLNKIRSATRAGYQAHLDRISREHGTEQLADINVRMIVRWHKDWRGENNYVTMAHKLVTMLKQVISFGATFLEHEQCLRLSLGLLKEKGSALRFEMGRPRNQQLTAEHANAVRAKAHEIGRPSIALAQAFQFECMLRQRDVIGEWVPLAEKVPSDLHTGNLKWARGIRWSEIDKNLVLRHTTSKKGKDVIIDLKRLPMVMEELQLLETRLGHLPLTGAVIVNEEISQPYTTANFARRWRAIATAAGIPAEVYNMDSRAGAISEGQAAGASIEDRQVAATHSHISQTADYSRAYAEASNRVSDLRVEYRARHKLGDQQ